jgi:hypothetical protein
MNPNRKATSPGVTHLEHAQFCNGQSQRFLVKKWQVLVCQVFARRGLAAKVCEGSDKVWMFDAGERREGLDKNDAMR